MQRIVCLSVLSIALAAAVGCQRGKSRDDKTGSAGSATDLPDRGSGKGTGGTGPGTAGPGDKIDVGVGSGTGSSAPKTPPLDIDSKEILARTETSASADVKHVLISWGDLADVYGGHMDPRAEKRSNADAARLAKDLAAQLAAKPDAIDELVKTNSEDPGSLSGDPYTVTADSSFVPEFKNLALRLKLNEVGIVRTQFGYHVMERVAPPPPDPVASNDLMTHPVSTEVVYVQHVLIGWKDVPAARGGQLDPRALQRTKADADKLATDVLAKVKAKGDMAALMKQYSEDPGSKDNARVYPIPPNAPKDGFTGLALRLQIGEAGIVKSPFGWHVIKRVPPPPPPPPDPLDSTDILKRKPVTDKAKVKHILLGWKDAHTDDPRGTGRSRADLETLVKKTVGRLKGGEKIEDLMKELSEDGGSAQTGTSYDVTPDAQLVEPFKNLGLRLNVGEIGVVKTQFGIHIIQRIE